MARLRITQSVETDGRSSIYREPSMPANRRQVRSGASPPRESLSQSPSLNSDKENLNVSGNGKDGVSTSHPPTPSSDRTEMPRPNKRPRLSERDTSTSTSAQTISQHERDEETYSDTEFYDPDQDIDERRKVRKDLRDLTKELNDSRAEYLQAESNGLRDTVRRADVIFEHVKQTSEATIDSRLLVTAGDLAAKKTTRLQLGDASQQIDVDEFVSKCISFMRRGDQQDGLSGEVATITPSTQRRAPTIGVDDDDDDEAQDDGNGLNWEWLGARACIPNNIRPPVPGFLLGPLSVQKRIRAPRVRRAALQRTGQLETIRPEELKAADIERQENSNLTHLCRGIERRLQTTIDHATTDLEQLLEQGKEKEAVTKMETYGICDDGGINLFKFVINPGSFGQTVENLFYVSFLIRDGDVGIAEDSRGMPTLHNISKAKSRSDDADSGRRRKTNQAIFTLDFDTWQELRDVFNITESLIPDRTADESVAEVATRGWYG